MRPLFLSLGGLLAVGLASAQVASDSTGNMPQLPVGQSFKQFEYPDYENGMLRYTLSAVEAKGITLNRAETTNLVIKVYDNGKVSTTISSPNADLYVAERKMRTKNTVLIERDDMEATSQVCDFDVTLKKYVLRDKVRVLLKHFDISANPADKKPAAGATPAATSATTPAPVPEPAPSSTPAPVPEPTPSMTPSPVPISGSLPTSPGTYGDTNSAPIPPSRSNSP